MITASNYRLPKSVYVVLIFFLLLYCSISLINHYEYRTFALDLGMFNQALYAYAHGEKALFTLDPSGVITPFFATHFSPIMYLYVPFYYLFGSYTLLLIQIGAILYGGVGIYKLAELKLSGNKKIIILIILIQFFCCWGIFSALSFDFHNNVIGAMLVPWFVYYFNKDKKLSVVLITILMLLTQETMGLWLMFIIAGVLIDNRKKVRKKEVVFFGIPLIIFCGLYAVTVISYVMPYLQGSQHNLQFSRYNHLGNNIQEIMIAVCRHPFDTLKMLFVNTTHQPDYNGIKAEFYITALLSGGIFLLFRPAYLLMTIPIIAQKMLSNNFAFWGINYQYSIEIIPLISFAIIATCGFLNKIKSIVFITFISTVFINFKTLDHRQSKWYNASNARFYQYTHYRADMNVRDVNKALAQIPDDAVLSVSSRLAPHAAFRRFIYHYPVIKDATYIVLDKTGEYPYPFNNKSEYLAHIVQTKADTSWKILIENKDVIIFQKR